MGISRDIFLSESKTIILTTLSAIGHKMHLSKHVSYVMPVPKMDIVPKRGLLYLSLLPCIPVQGMQVREGAKMSDLHCG